MQDLLTLWSADVEEYRRCARLCDTEERAARADT